MTFNAELAERVLTQIRDHPETWDQKTWCGTACCFAGHAAALSGYRQTSPYSSYVLDDESGAQIYVPDVAQELLGLPQGDANLLFKGTNTLEDLERLVRAASNGENMRRVYEVEISNRL